MQLFDENTRAVYIIDRILEKAVSCRASDVHLDINREHIYLRFRIDGIMEYIGHISNSIYSELYSRFKILAGLRTDIHTEPQDGRYEVKIFDRSYNIRISFMPTYYGESVVLRLLPFREDKSYTFEDIGLNTLHIQSIISNLTKTSGIILITGPTGSGKTTTLNICLKIKSQEPISVISLEDPIEYEVKGVRQVNVRQNSGFTFARALKACLRQDPDVIMVGEIRDRETAEIAIHTALTGHLVLSTLHAGRANQVLERLYGMGIEKYLILETLNLIIAQRLVRKVCGICNMINTERCESCRHTGYDGRTIIAEIIDITKLRKEKNMRTLEVFDIDDYIKSLEYISLEKDAKEKISKGITTLLEMKRVL